MLAEIQGIVTIAATGTGIYVALAGLSAWKREMIGRRDIELCQKVIELFYEAEYRMDGLRSPMSFSSEGDKREREENETEQETKRRNHLFVPIARLNKQIEFWSELQSYAFRMRALFGKDGYEGFSAVNEALSSFRAAAVTRYNALYQNPNGLDAQTQQNLEKKVWRVGEDDEIAAQMKAGISTMEALCVPIVRANYQGPLRAGWARIQSLLKKR